MADLEISQFTNGNVPTDTNFVGGYKDADTIGGNRRWSFSNIASYISTKLSLGTIVTQDADNVNITGGTIDGVTMANAAIDTVTQDLNLDQNAIVNALYITGVAGSFLSPTNTPGDNLFLAAWDVDGAITKTFCELLSNNTPSLAFSQPAGGILTWDGGAIGETTPVSIRGNTPSATTISGITATLALVDAEFFQICSNALTQVITIPLNADVAFPLNTEIDFFQQGAGQVQFIGDLGVTIQSVVGIAPKISAQFGHVTIKKIDTDTWAVMDDIAA